MNFKSRCISNRWIYNPPLRTTTPLDPSVRPIRAITPHDPIARPHDRTNTRTKSGLQYNLFSLCVNSVFPFGRLLQV